MSQIQILLSGRRGYCRWKGFCATWLAGAPSQRVQKFILRPCLQNLFDTIFIQNFTDPYQKWKDPQHVGGWLHFWSGSVKVCMKIVSNKFWRLGLSMNFCTLWLGAPASQVVQKPFHRQYTKLHDYASMATMTCPWKSLWRSISAFNILEKHPRGPGGSRGMPPGVYCRR